MQFLNQHTSKYQKRSKTFRMYPISRFVYVLHWLATRLYSVTGVLPTMMKFIQLIRDSVGLFDTSVERVVASLKDDRPYGSGMV